MSQLHPLKRNGAPQTVEDAGPLVFARRRRSYSGRRGLLQGRLALFARATGGCMGQFLQRRDLVLGTSPPAIRRDGVVLAPSLHRLALLFQKSAHRLRAAVPGDDSCVRKWGSPCLCHFIGHALGYKCDPTGMQPLSEDWSK
jgi:hypothetical protein